MLKFDLRNEDQFQAWAAENIDVQFGILIQDILENGTEESDPARTEDKWLTVIDSTHKLSNTAIAFPALLSKHVNVVGAIDELSWMVRGETNIETLNSKIWNEWASADGSIGWGYGRMMRALPDVKILQIADTPNRPNLSREEYARQGNELRRCHALGTYNTSEIEPNVWLVEGTIDQLYEALQQLKDRSRSRRITIRTYNPQYVSLQNLPPCHTDFTFNVTKATTYDKQLMAARGHLPSDDTLHITVAMRSNDVGLGRPFNVVQYSALHHLFAIHCGMNIGGFCLNATNTHIYTHHVEALKKQLANVEELLAGVRASGRALEYPMLLVDPGVTELTSKELLDTMGAHMFKLTPYNNLGKIPMRVTI